MLIHNQSFFSFIENYRLFKKLKYCSGVKTDPNTIAGLKEQFSQKWKFAENVFKENSIIVWTLADGTHSLNRIHWWASEMLLNFSKFVPIKKQLIYILDGLGELFL